MGPKTTQLLSILSRQVELLAIQGERHWKGELSRCLATIHADDFSGVERLLRAYGGMGSLSDLVLSPSAADDEFNSLRSEAYDLAQAISREQ